MPDTITFEHPSGITGVAKLLSDNRYFGSAIVNGNTITFQGTEETIESEFVISVSNYLHWPWNK